MSASNQCGRIGGLTAGYMIAVQQLSFKSIWPESWENSVYLIERCHFPGLQHSQAIQRPIDQGTVSISPRKVTLRISVNNHLSVKGHLMEHQVERSHVRRHINGTIRIIEVTRVPVAS
jgi:hypothetical protein